MPELRIRSADLTDLKVLTDLYEKLIREQTAFDQFHQLLPKPDFEKLVQGFLSGGNNQFFLAEQNGKILGFIRLNIYLGNNLERLRSSAPEPSWKRFTPRRIVRKILVRVLSWLEKPLETPPLLAQRRIGYIADLYVLPEARRQKIGSQLVDQALAWFKGKQIDLVYLQALSENQAGVQFWQKQGFSSFRYFMRKKI